MSRSMSREELLALIPELSADRLAALTEAGLIGRAVYVERGTMAGERVIPLAEKADDVAPYFSMVLVPGQRATNIRQPFAALPYGPYEMRLTARAA